MYERFFGLADAPFRLTPDPRYLFLSAKHADALAHLRLGLSESSGFVCITGDVGTGKTTVLRHFLAELGPDVSTAYVVTPTLSAVELLQTINVELGLPSASSSKKQLVDQLNAHLLAQRTAGRTCIVVVDEAQALAIDVLEELRLLSNLETTTEKLLRIVLVGQPQLRALLLHPELVQLNQRITLRWHIGPLDARETRAYVRHRIAVASGGQQSDLFSAAALRAIHRRSGGVPRLVNMLAHRAMLAAFARGRRRVTSSAVRRAVHEIESVPLPGRPGGGRRLAWSAFGAAAAATVLAVGVSRLRPAALPGAVTETTAAEAVQAASLPASSPAAVADAPATLPAAGGPNPDGAMAPSSTPNPGEPETTADAGPARTDPHATLAARLAAVDHAASSRRALAALLASWQLAPLIVPEGGTPADFPAIAERRGLEHLALAANAALLRLVDVPAIVELDVPTAGGPRLAAVMALGADRARLVAGDGEPLVVPVEVLEREWTGQAWLFWRDFEGLGPTVLESPARGPRVARLQGLLGRVGHYQGPGHGLFDRNTMDAVFAFQRSRYIVADGVVGRLTRLVLYAAAGGYSRPTLAAAGAAS